MSVLKNEQTLLQSDNGHITLTTHRIIEHSSTASREVMLSDLVSYEIVKRKSGYHKTLSIIFLITTAISGAWSLFKKQDNERLGPRLSDAIEMHSVSNQQELEIINAVFGFSLFLLICSVILFLRSGDGFFRITGKYNSFEFSINNLSKQSLQKFEETLATESEKRKRE